MIVRNGAEVKATDPCPTITVKDKPYCLDEACFVRKLGGSVCPPFPPENSLPDLLVGMTEFEFWNARRKGLWNSRVKGE